ncbi:unnamed protein product [Medioppia subpectinata]|uniref:Ribosomal protein eL8/eL30/eS12/Gadd45 domain-containing protein n=1 Tax=Medioppia subpectinata TaxID=1979941 RepID=A0A7R9KDC6_9ACAR|nr:unnamed protein product [Medioppia subpectinata]CAG2100025.1 unnamed protein product [Medioppia subpectinata]
MKELLSDKKSQELYVLVGKLIPEKKVKIGMNETIKAIHNGTALLVVLADDSDPKCLTEASLTLCEQKGIEYVYVSSRSAMGKACKLERGVIALAIYDNKDTDSSTILSQIALIKR